jgi:hypothetical protein
VRVILALLALLAFAYGFWFGLSKDVNGVSVAAALAVGALFLIVALAGMLPSSLKVGDFEVKLDQARADGATQGAKLAAAATGMSQGQLQQAAEQVLDIRDNNSLMRALRAVHTSADVVRQAAALEPDQLDENKRKELLAMLTMI